MAHAMCNAAITAGLIHIKKPVSAPRLDSPSATIRGGTAVSPISQKLAQVYCSEEKDVILIGAGMSGLYQLLKLRE